MTDRPSERIQILTGMHRSGTSFLAKRLVSEGVVFPGPHLPANEDNPEGYWEASDVVALNNRILSAAGLDWRAPDPLSPSGMRGLVAAFRDEAARLLVRLGSDADGSFAIKDPRLCRTLPVWLAGAEDAGKPVELIATIRPAEAVARSLYRRRQDERFRPAAVDVPGDAILLWLRYMLDLEQASRKVRRKFVNFSDLDRFSLSAALSETKRADIRSAKPGTEPGASTWRQLAAEIAELLPDAEGQATRARLDDIRRQLDSHCPPAGKKSFNTAGSLLRSRTYATVPKEGQGASSPVIAFVSGEPDGRGHIYRIEHRIWALMDEDIAVVRGDPARHSPEDIVASSDLVLVFRKQMDAWLDRLFNAAQRRNVPVVFDIDDLLVRPELVSPDTFRYLEGKPESVVRDWQERAAKYALSAEAATACWVTTEPLADELRRLNRNVDVLRNGLAEDPLKKRGPSPPTGPAGKKSGLVIGYASGTPTHDRDFLEAAEALAATLQKYADARLEIIGDLSENSLSAFNAVRNQVVRRPIVDFYQLPRLMSRFDINLAPLEAGNVFCDCKSELKFFEAGCLGVPTIASPTRPFRSVIKDGVNGYIPHTSRDWQHALELLAGAPDQRRKTGERARETSLQLFGPEQQKRDFLDRLKKYIPGLGPVRASMTKERAPQTGDAGFSLMEVMVGLAITAMISILIFSSLLSQVRQADIVRSSTQSAFSDIASGRLVEVVVSKTLPSWPEEEEGRFRGTEFSMSGIAAFSLFGGAERLQAYELRLLPEEDKLLLQIETGDGTWDVDAVAPGSRFRYLGGDGAWHDTWPVTEAIGRTAQEMERFFANQGLPRMVCVWNDETGDIAYQISIQNTDILPTRTRDLADLSP